MSIEGQKYVWHCFSKLKNLLFVHLQHNLLQLSPIIFIPFGCKAFSILRWFLENHTFQGQYNNIASDFDNKYLLRAAVK